jgi:two-component system, NarL family, sensor histidine kinase UhpB
LPVPATLDDGSAIVLQADPTNEIGEVWTQSRDAVLVLAGFAVLSVVLMSAVLGRALRSLENLSTAFDRVGKGDYHGSLPVHGPPELTRLANGFNVMTERLATVAAQNHRLNERLLTLQAEERADLARDLHDEIGPMLFAIDMTAAAIERLAGSERETGIPRHVEAIHDSVGRMQRHIRLILGRLRPLQAIGLSVAIDRLATFWRGRRPDIAFGATVAIDDHRICDDLKETIYRVVQEATSNAIRHGRPSRLDIAITHDRADAIRVAVTDDGIGMSADGVTARGSTRLGLIGMRERVMAMAGSLVIGPGHNGRGLSLIVRLSCEHSQHADVPE